MIGACPIRPYPPDRALRFAPGRELAFAGPQFADDRGPEMAAVFRATCLTRMSLRALELPTHDAHYLFFQDWYFLLGDLPHDRPVDNEIPVYREVPECPDIPPGDVR